MRGNAAVTNIVLLALAIACPVLAYLADRYSYELCHRGLPLAALLVSIPVVGAMAGLGSMFYRAPVSLLFVKLCVTAANACQVVIALLMLTGVGIAACG
jgi:hypothetical protein